MNSKMLVGKNYVMDPETQDVLYAEELKNGMVVLVESSENRFETDGTILTPSFYKSLIANRWCEVHKIKRVPSFEGESTIYFIGIYADGLKAVRNYSTTTGFYVMKDSLPQDFAEKTEEKPAEKAGYAVTDIRNENDPAKKATLVTAKGEQSLSSR